MFTWFSFLNETMLILTLIFQGMCFTILEFLLKSREDSNGFPLERRIPREKMIRRKVVDSL